MVDIRILAKYPFLKEGSRAFGNILIEDILKLPKFSDARELAISQLEKALGVDKKIFINDNETRYIAYQISRMILSYLNDPILTNRFAIMFRDMVEREILKEDPEIILKVCDSLSIYAKIEGKNFKISFTDYVKLIRKLGEKYSLYYQRLNMGYVHFDINLEREKVAKLIREAYVNYFKNDVENLRTPDQIFKFLKN
ncbi:MAG: hypothetical protein ABWK01_02240, partial [Infirmifilum sp.]